MNPTDQQLKNRNLALQNINQGLPQNTGIAPSVITADSLSNPEQPLKIPPTPTPTDYSGAITSSLESLLQGFNTPTKTEQQGTELQTSILDTLKTLGGKSAKKQELETEAGLPGQRQDLQNVINQLQGLQKEAIAIPLQIQQESEGRGRTAGGVQPIQTGRLRENTIKSLGLAAIGQTLQGNIALAESSIQNALQAEFEPEEQKLKVLGQLYEFNKDSLEREDKKRSDQLAIYLDERKRILDNQKAEKSLTYELTLEAVRKGAPPNIAQKMAESTPDGAMAIGAEFFGAEFKQQAEQVAFERGIKTRELAIREAEFNLNRRMNILALAKAGDAGAIQELGYDPNNTPLSLEEITALEDQRSVAQRDLGIVERTINNDTGLRASAGLIRGGFIGTAFGSGAGLATLPYNMIKRNDFLADASYIIKNLTFNKIKELSDQGIKLTPISEKELKAMGEASSVLVAAAQFDDGGNLTGFRLSEKRVREQFNLVQQHYKNAMDDIDVKLFLTPEEQAQITKS